MLTGEIALMNFSCYGHLNRKGCEISVTYL